MSRRLRRSGRLAAGIGLVVLLASCAYGETTPAQNITATTARLGGLVHNTVAESTQYWFEYGLTSSYGIPTPHHSVDVTSPSTAVAVNEVVSGLSRGRGYHARLCTLGSDGKTVCGGDQPFNTVGDSVSGSGTIFSIPQIGYSLGIDADASSAPDGSDPTGIAGAGPGSFYIKWSDSGPVTCLHVEGNRASIGFMAEPPDIGIDADPIPEMIFVEDNGPTGDRIGRQTLAAPATTCPAPTAADFPDFVIAGMQVPPVITSGDIVVHDATPN